jgi:hypothetical protein
MYVFYTLVSMKTLLACVAALMCLNVSAQHKAPAIPADNYTIIAFNPSLPDMKEVYATAKPKTGGLTKAEIATVDQLLQQSIIDYNLKQEEEFAKWKELDSTLKKEEFLITLTDYKRQYVPVINDDNEPEVWVNALCYWAGDRWRKEIIRVADGGKCYFNVRINLSKKSYGPMAVNAP